MDQYGSPKLSPRQLYVPEHVLDELKQHYFDYKARLCVQNALLIEQGLIKKKTQSRNAMALTSMSSRRSRSLGNTRHALHMSPTSPASGEKQLTVEVLQLELRQLTE